MSGNPPRYDPPKYEPLITQYTLKYRKPVPCTDLLKWGRWMERHKKHVRSTYIGKTWVSTVFLGIDHNFRLYGKPLLFETMVFPNQDLQFRCTTWREALYQHWEVVRSVKAKAGWKHER